MYYIRTAGLTVCISVHPDKERRKNIYHKAMVLKTKTKQKGAKKKKNKLHLLLNLKNNNNNNLKKTFCGKYYEGTVKVLVDLRKLHVIC